MAMLCRNLKHALIILWRIENIGFWENKFTIQSPNLKSRLLDGKSFQLFLFWYYPSEQEEYIEKYLIIKLKFNGEIFNIPIDCEVSLIALDESEFVNDLVRNQVVQENGLNFVFSSVTNNEVFMNQRSNFLPNDTLTLRIRIWKSLGDFLETEFFSLGSRVELLYSSILWSIPGVSTLELNQEVTTPVRHEFFNTSNDLLLKFSFQGESLGAASAQVQLTTASNVQEPISSWHVSIMMNETKVLKNFETKWNWQKFEIGSRNNLLCYEYYDVQNDILHLLCKINLFHNTGVIEKSLYGFPNAIVDEYLNTTSSQPRTDPRDIALQGSDSRENIQNLFSEENGTDFELRLERDFIPVHKVVLSARSAFFRNMFSTHLNGSEFNYIEIRNLDIHALRQMVNFIYTGTVDGLELENAVTLYCAANQYQVQSLQRECRSFFISSINVENVSDILHLAHQHQDDELKSLLVHHVISRYFSEVTNTPQWAQFMEREPELAVKSMHQSYLKHIKDKTERLNLQ